jgi:23S rRNA (uridine2552-2'-O)-methyltransferase
VKRQGFIVTDTIRRPFPLRRRLFSYEREFAGSFCAEHVKEFGEVRMTDRDKYYNRAKQEGYRSRAAYKLKQVDEQVGLFGPGNAVVDLGAAPGGWLQVAAEAVGPRGRVVGVDLQRIDEFDETEGKLGPDDRAHVTTIRGDMTEESTLARLREELGADEGDRPVDVVVSDMAPNMTGQYTLDHARSVHLARQAFEVARELLAPGGDLVVKVFDGPDLDGLRDDVAREFEYVRDVRPEASRDSSSELYLVAKGRITAPVAEGERVDVDVVDVGSEGDGIAKLDGYTVFVPGTAAGDRVRVRITDLKPRFGFGEVVEELDGDDGDGTE